MAVIFDMKENVKIHSMRLWTEGKKVIMKDRYERHKRKENRSYRRQPFMD